jgi:uncharacterized protein with PIN domain
MTTHRFAVDKMLGRLATWLRLIGQDATYGAHLSGRTLLRHARSEQRAVLTRDRRVLRARADVRVLFIESDHFREQLQQVVSAFGIDPFAQIFTRCARCNASVVPVPKAHVEARVPAYVFSTQERFVRCPHCQRIYWPATHYDRVRDELQRMGFRTAPSGL